MKGIMFNDTYGLESAVLNGAKTRTWRADKKPRYEVGEVVAIKQCYCRVVGANNRFFDDKFDSDTFVKEIFRSAGWRNKMFVKNELMPHKIRIKAVKKCKLQDLTDAECIDEGIKKPNPKRSLYMYGLGGRIYPTAKDAFAGLIDRLNGKGYWDNNPDGYVYEFELVE